MLIAAAIKQSRKAYEQINGIGLDLAQLPDAASAVVRACDEYYARDPDAQSVSTDVLRNQIIRRWGDSDITDSIMAFVDSFPTDVSGVNIAEEHRLLQLRRVETALAGLMATGGNPDEVHELLERREQLASAESDQDQTKFRLTLDDFKGPKGERIPLYPGSLNRYLDGGVLRGHNVTVYGRPDSGKSMFTLNCSANLIQAGYRVLYVANEEPAQDITKRLLSNLSHQNIANLHDLNVLGEALEYYSDVYERWHLYHKAGCTINDIARVAARLKPDVLVVDQLKNIAVAEDNRALQLDKLARQVRELGIAHNCVTMSVTQAGESGEQELNLRLSDIEWSNTGIPGAADLMVGVGVNTKYDKESKRMISLPKNKINGRHGAFPVWVDTKQCRFLSAHPSGQTT